RSDHGRPGARCPREHRHALLGRRGEDRGRWRAKWRRLPRADRLCGSGALLKERALIGERVREEVGDVPAIDGLRGLAVLWVIAFHYIIVREENLSADPWISALHRLPALDTLLRNGYLGVDLFFLISGFLLALPWLVHARAGLPPPSALRFYARRVRRIVPAYYVQLFLLFTVALPLLGGITYWRSDLYVDLWNGIAHGLFLQDTSPLTSGSLHVNGALWTLPIEVQFYALLPLAAPLFVRAPRAMLVAATAASLAWQWAGAHDLRPLVDMELELGSHWRWSEAVVRDVIAMQLPAYLAHFALGIVLGRMWLASRAAIVSSATKLFRWLAMLAALALLAASLEGMLPVPHEHQRMIPALAIAVLLFGAVSS